LQVDRTTVSKSREGFECLRSGIGADFLPALHRHSRDSIVARRARKNGSAPARESIGLFNCACARLRLRTRGRDTRSTCEPSRLLKRVDSNSAAFLLTRAHARARVKCKWNNCSYESGECAAPPPSPLDRAGATSRPISSPFPSSERQTAQGIYAGRAR